MHNDIFKTISLYSPLIEPSIYGQYYVDMTGMSNIYRSNKDAGNLILKDIHDKIKLNSALGISANKLVSSITTLTVAQSIYEVDNGCESQFIAPLPAHILPVVKEKFIKRIVEFVLIKQVKEIQEILKYPQTASVVFGEYYRQINLQAHGRDYSVVTPPLSKPHIIKQKNLTTDTNDITILEAVVQMLAEQIGYELRVRKQISRSICLEIHYSDGFRNSRKGSLNFNDDKSLTTLCLNLFTKANYRRNRIRSLLIDAADLESSAQQLDMFNNQQMTNQTLSKTIDKIRSKYGAQSIHSAAALVA